MTDTDGPVTGSADDSAAVSVLRSATRLRIILSGPMDATMNDELVTASREAERVDLPVEVDTRGITFMDSTVIATIAHLANRLQHRIVFIDPPDRVRFLLEVTNIGEVVDIVDQDPGFPD